MRRLLRVVHADLKKLTQLRAGSTFPAGLKWAEIRVIGKVREQVNLEIQHGVVNTVSKHLEKRGKILEPKDS